MKGVAAINRKTWEKCNHL